MISKLKSAVAALALAATPAFAVDLEFYFPVAVGGAAANTIEELTAQYLAEKRRREHRRHLCRFVSGHSGKGVDSCARW